MSTITSYISLKSKIEAFCNQNIFVKRFGGSFQSGLNMFANENEKYPIVFMVPISQTLGEITSTFDIDLYCYDIVRDDKENLDLVISQTNMVLNDFWIYVKQGADIEIDIIGQPFMEPINNDLLDNATGWRGRFTIEVNNYCINELPIN